MRKTDPLKARAASARRAGDRASVTAPLSASARAAHYRRQMAPRGQLVVQLTPAQSKRLRKKMNAMDAVETRSHVSSKTR